MALIYTFWTVVKRLCILSSVIGQRTLPPSELAPKFHGLARQRKRWSNKNQFSCLTYHRKCRNTPSWLRLQPNLLAEALTFSLCLPPTDWAANGANSGCF